MFFNGYDRTLNQREITEVSLSDPNMFVRRNGSLIREGIWEGLLGQSQKNADVYTLKGDILIRECYRDYSFKGPFGGYWLSGEKDIHVWEKVSDCDCDCFKE